MAVPSTGGDEPLLVNESVGGMGASFGMGILEHARRRVYRTDTIVPSHLSVYLRQPPKAADMDIRLKDPRVHLPSDREVADRGRNRYLGGREVGLPVDILTRELTDLTKLMRFLGSPP